MADAFLSYGREDHEKAEALVRALSDLGITVWWDRNLTAGEEFRTEIGRELDSAGTVVVLWSKTSVKKPFVLDEATIGRQRGVLIPCAVEAGVPLPLGFGTLHTEFARDWSPDAVFYLAQAIAHAIRRILPHPAVEPEKQSQLVILVHGIRTRAKWMTNIRPCLEAAGFAVEPTNYGRFDLLRFLAPLRAPKRSAVDKVWRDVRSAIEKHPGKPVSFIAHSFGTLVVATILKEQFQFQAHRVIFCGSVVPADFEFESIDRRFTVPILNEVGTLDFWPVLAESVTWGYGSTGTHGFNRPLFRDRYHKNADHCFFLTREFAANWVPFLQRGEIPEGDGDAISAKTPWWVDTIAVLHLKYVLAAAIALLIAVFWCRPPTYTEQLPEVAILAQPLKHISTNANNAGCSVPCQWLGGISCNTTIQVDPPVLDVVVCLDRGTSVTYADPVDGAKALAALAPGCVEVVSVGPSAFDVVLSKNSTGKTVTGPKERSRLVCNPNPSCEAAVMRTME